MHQKKSRHERWRSKETALSDERIESSLVRHRGERPVSRRDESSTIKLLQHPTRMRQLALTTKITAAERSGENQISGDQKFMAPRSVHASHEVAIVLRRVSRRVQRTHCQSADLDGLAFAE
jgi:hypothetical protein